jgi:hypothetical protein
MKNAKKIEKCQKTMQDTNLWETKKRVTPSKKTIFFSEPLVLENEDFGETFRQEAVSQIDDTHNN